MPLPAVLTIQSGINKLRYATLIGIKQAKNKPLRKVALAEVQSAIGENLQKIERLYVPQKTKKTEHIEGSPARSPRSWWINCATNCVCCEENSVRLSPRRAC
jgi:electron transfer flavoprotein beta subunit